MRWILASRRRVLGVALVVLAVLDGARSVFARVGYARPVSVWQPKAEVYADLAWPPGVDVRPDAPLGQRVYAQRCAVCHGPDGRGNGPAAPSLIPRPRDFTRGEFRYKSTAAGAPPTDADVFDAVANGLPTSAMPYWRDVLDPASLRAVVAYVEGMSHAFDRPPPAPLVVPPRVPPTEASVVRGRALYMAKGCVACHGADGRARQELRDAKGYPVVTRDLTAPWTFRGGADPEQVWLRLTTGLAPGPMPSFAAATTAAERWDLVNYVLSLARTPPWAPGGKLDGPGQQGDRVQRGQYLVHAEMCGLCHTMINRTGIYRADDAYLAGGMRVGAYPHGVYVSRNLTSDRWTGLGDWTAEQVATAIRTGRTPTRMLNPWAMPWSILHNLTDSDAVAIGSYLKTLPPVGSQPPAPLHYGLVETVVAKIVAGLPAAMPARLTYADGNFSQPARAVSRDVVQRVLVGAQWSVVVVALALLLLAGPPERWLLGGFGGWARAWGAVIGVVVVAGIIAIVYGTPALRIIPADRVAGAIAARIPQANPSLLRGPEEVALAMRGRYVFSVASCALCHGFDGSGGSKLSWVPLGTIWSRNITPDSATGIGAWTDAEIERALRSGVSRDGRALHWQAMIWDHASNWDEEDIRALITYLRAIPPVHHAIPLPRPPSPGDCAVYTFWLKPSVAPGCQS